MGVALVEADVRLFRGRAEVRHLKTVGPLPIFWDRWKLANPFARRLVLAELLEAIAPRTELMLDLKGRNRRLSQLVLEPFHGRPDVRTVVSIGSKRQLRALPQRFDGRRFDGVSIHERLLDGETVHQLGRYADVVMTWPVRTVEQARRLVGWGVQGLITDAPEDLVAVLPAGTVD